MPDRRRAWFLTSLAACTLLAGLGGVGVLTTPGSNRAAATVPVHVDLRPLSDDLDAAGTVPAWLAPALDSSPMLTGTVAPEQSTVPAPALPAALAALGPTAAGPQDSPPPAAGAGSQRHSPVARAARMAVIAAGLGFAGAVDKPTVLPTDEPPLRLASLIESPHTTTLVRRPPSGDQPRTIEHTIVVSRGDTLYRILETYGVSTTDAVAVARALASEFPPQDLREGQELTLVLRPENGDDATPLALSLVDDNRDIQVILKEAGVYEARVAGIPVSERETHRALASIHGSLYGTAREQGVPDSIIVRMMRTHSYDVDFQREIRAGDLFEVLYSEADGSDTGGPAGSGQLLFSSLTTKGETHSYYRFTSADGTSDYYSADGVSAKKPLMKTPINGARISSGFGVRRHPILGYNRMHGGTDFAAPVGTPVFAAGDGIVEVAGRNGGYGNYIRLRHKDGLQTAYAHLSRFAKGIKPGKRVRQGDVIAFVGSTGTSTGPHLHYEVHVNGKKENPLTVKVAGGGRRLEGTELAAFEAERDRIDQLRAEAPVEALVAAARP